MVGQRSCAARNERCWPGFGRLFWSKRRAWDLRCARRCTRGWPLPSLYAAEHATSNSLVGEFGKPSLHQVDPGTVGRGEVDMKSWAFRKPLADHGGFVRSVVIQDDMDIQSGGHVRLDHIEELAKFRGAMAALQLGDHAAGLQFQRGKQPRSPMTFIVVRAALQWPWP